jgi:plasmid stability protein
MASVTIRNLDDEVVARLKDRAKANKRSLEAELREILARSAEAMTREEFIAFAKHVRTMTPEMPQTDSTLLIREDRDSDHGREP